jgi:hypothetical protein
MGVRALHTPSSMVIDEREGSNSWHTARQVGTSPGVGTQVRNFSALNSYFHTIILLFSDRFGSAHACWPPARQFGYAELLDLAPALAVSGSCRAR